MRPSVGSTRWWFAAALAVPAAAALILLRPAEDPLKTLQTQLHRTVEGRLSGQPYAPLRAISASHDLAIWRAAAQLHRDAQTRPSLENTARYAKACLLVGQREQALQLFEQVAGTRRTDSAVLADLSAAQLANRKPYAAAESAARALASSPQSHAAAFNWALALESLANYPAASAAWKQYLLLDETSGWAREAREHVRRLEKPARDWATDREVLLRTTDTAAIRQIVQSHPQRARYLMQDELLAAWAAAATSTDDARVQAIAHARAEEGDSFLKDVIRAATPMTPSTVTALETFAAAREELLDRDMETAAALFEKASERLMRVRSPMAIAAEIFLASTDFYRGRSDAALTRLAVVEKTSGRELARYACLAAEVEWTRGLVFYRLGKPNESLAAYRRALRHAKAAREKEAEVALASLMSGLIDIVGEPDEADHLRIDALRELAAIGHPPQRTYIGYSQATYAALRADRPHVALSFVQSQLPIARNERTGSGDTLLLAETELQRALALRALEKINAAEAAIAEARAYAAQVKTAALRDRVTSDIDYVAGMLATRNDPRRAVQSVTSALTTWERYGWQNRTAYGRLARGDALLRAGDPAGAEADYRAGIAMMEKQRASLDEPMLRVTYFERAEHLFDRLVELLLKQSRALDAFEVVERKRARELLARASPMSAGLPNAPLPALRVAAVIPSSAVLVEYAVTANGVAIWAMTNGRVDYSFAAIRRTAVQEQVESFNEAIARDDDARIRREGSLLFQTFLAPALSSARSAMRLIVVPDGALHALPFACLVDAKGRYAVEQRVIMMAPSATTFVRAKPRDRAVDSLLAVAEAAPASELPRLKNSIPEVIAIAHEYTRARVFRGAEVTPQRFLNLAANASVVHFSGHAQTNIRQPSSSALLFEANSHEEGRLAAAAIGVSRLRAAPLVVLAACRTGDGRIWKNEGVDSLAAAFLLAGARGVVATMWDIDDEPSAHFFYLFHVQLRRGASDWEALRAAQLSMIQNTNPAWRRPKTWAGTVLIGTT